MKKAGASDFSKISDCGKEICEIFEILQDAYLHSLMTDLHQTFPSCSILEYSKLVQRQYQIPASLGDMTVNIVDFRFFLVIYAPKLIKI